MIIFGVDMLCIATFKTKQKQRKKYPFKFSPSTCNMMYPSPVLFCRHVKPRIRLIIFDKNILIIPDLLSLRAAFAHYELIKYENEMIYLANETKGKLRELKRNMTVSRC